MPRTEAAVNIEAEVREMCRRGDRFPHRVVGHDATAQPNHLWVKYCHFSSLEARVSTLSAAPRNPSAVTDIKTPRQEIPAMSASGRPPTFIRDHEVGGVKLEIHMDPEGNWSAGCGATVWDSALSLSAYLEGDGIDVKGKRVLEIGAGTGLVGLVCAVLGATTILADHPRALPLLEHNAEENGKITGAVVECKPLEWGNASHAKELKMMGGDFDLVVCSDPRGPSTFLLCAGLNSFLQLCCRSWLTACTGPSFFSHFAQH